MTNHGGSEILRIRALSFLVREGPLGTVTSVPKSRTPSCR